jgi:hypothetical protein
MVYKKIKETNVVLSLFVIGSLIKDISILMEYKQSNAFLFLVMVATKKG